MHILTTILMLLMSFASAQLLAQDTSAGGIDGKKIELPPVDIQFHFAKSTDNEIVEEQVTRFKAEAKVLKLESVVLGKIECAVVDTRKTNGVSLLVPKSAMLDEVVQFMDILHKLKIDDIQLETKIELQWKKYTDDDFDANLFVKPTLVAIMKDLCPGCKAKRDALWENKRVKAEIDQRGIVLFNGNAATEKGLEEKIKTKFEIETLPVVIIHSTPMGDEPIVLEGIPDPDQVIAALEKKFPLPKRKHQSKK